MGKQENVALSVEAVKEIFWDLLKEQKQTLLTIFSNSTKLIHQRLDKRKTNIININVEINKNIKDVDELQESLQMYQETNDNKLVEVDNSLGKKTERK